MNLLSFSLKEECEEKLLIKCGFGNGDSETRLRVPEQLLQVFVARSRTI